MTIVQVVRTGFSVAFIAIVSAVFAISFAAILYSGELSDYLDRGAGLALLGCVVLGVVGAFGLSYRGSVVQVQDVPAILLSGAAATLISSHGLSGDALFATVACLVAVSALATGIIAIFFGQMKLALLARFIPYPVLAGFLAATGLLLFLGGIGVAVGITPDLGNVSQFTHPARLIQWVPPCIAAIFIVIMTRVIKDERTLPAALLAATVGFYVIIAMLGLDRTAAQEAGLILGPYQTNGFLGGFSPDLIRLADWGAVASQLPVILTIVAISLVGTTLNASGLELELGRDLDINHEVRGVGLANSLAALVGSMPGYHLLGETILAHRLGMTGVLAGLSSAAGCALVLILGASVLAVLPVGLFATVIAYLGVDLLYTWLWEERRHLNRRDYAIVVVIPVVAITFSFLAAIATGLVAALCFFVVAYAKLDVIRSQTTVAARRSLVERPDDELRILTDIGHRGKIIDLSGYLFFGSANVLREKVRAILDQSDDTLWMVLDFKRVSGIDISTWHILRRLEGDCRQKGARLLLTGIVGRTDADLTTPVEGIGATQFNSLAAALEHVEDVMLTEHRGDAAAVGQDILDQITNLFSAEELAEFTTELTFQPGEAVIEIGSRNDDIYILQTGELVVSVPQKNGALTHIARIRPTSLVGEMAYYQESARSADIHADRVSELTRIDMRGLDRIGAARPEGAAAFHKLIARHIARRLRRTTLLARDLDG